MAEDQVIPFFYMRAVKNNYKSKQQGRPVYENREYVQILMPGNDTEKPDRPVTEEDKERWPERYDQFLKKQEQAETGTPLEQWPRMDPARVSALKDQHIYTVDALAELPDDKLDKIGPDGHDLKQQAQSFLQAAEATVSHDEIDRLRQRIEELEAENAELRKNQKKKPGRPRKSEQKETESA